MGGGKKKRSGKEPRHRLSDEELNDTLAEFRAGSDRVTAIMGAALVENILIGGLLTCLKDESEVHKLFDTIRGPLNSFYGRIVVGRALGLYDGVASDALHTIRQIRNEFAHNVVSLNFENKDIAAKCAKLSRYREPDPSDDGREVSEARRIYEDACLVVSAIVLASGNKNLRRRLRREQRELRQVGTKSEKAKEELGRLASLLDLIPPDLDEGSE